MPWALVAATATAVAPPSRGREWLRGRVVGLHVRHLPRVGAALQVGALGGLDG
jgi:hypothetical protein